MKYSFVVPTFNSSEYIESTLQSIVREVGSEQHEILLVDDCSSDIKCLESVVDKFGSAEIVRKSKKTNAADSRNIGIEKSKGLYIFLIDSDDLFLFGTVGRRAVMHEKDGAGIVFGNYYERRNGRDYLISLPEYAGEDVRHYLMDMGGDFRTSSISICRSYFKGSKFDAISTKHQDWIFGIRVYDSGERIAFDSCPSALIDCERGHRMSFKTNVDASSYFVSNYLTDAKHQRSFSRKNWVSVIKNKDVGGSRFFASIFCPNTVGDYFRLIVFRVFTMRPVISSTAMGLHFAKRFKNQCKKFKELHRNN